MRKVLFITMRDARYGFGLSGAAQRTAEAKDATDMLERVSFEPDIGLVAIDERLLAEISEEVLKDLEQKWDGVVVALPTPELPGTKVEDYAMELIRRTIGYHLRIS